MPHGFAVAALRQTAGRGRGDNRWHSPPGGLYYSIHLNALAHRPPTELVFVAGIALAETVLHFGAKPEDIALKWPNDLLLQQKKVSGILAELEGTRSVILGIGVNVAVETGEWTHVKGKFPPASLHEFGLKTAPEAFGKWLHTRVLANFGRYQSQGFSEIRRLWQLHCGWIGRAIEVAAGADKPTLRGTFLGIDSDGSLMLRDEAGKAHTLSSAEVLCCLS